MPTQTKTESAKEALAEESSGAAAVSHITTDGRTSPDGEATDSESQANSQAEKRLSAGNNEDNVLLDPDVLTDFATQALVLTVLVCDLLYIQMILFSYSYFLSFFIQSGHTCAQHHG